MLERQILSHDDAASQQGLTENQRKVLHIIATQAYTHGRSHTFDLGNTRRTFEFGPGETYLNTAAIADQLQCSKDTVRRVVRQLRDAGVVSFRNHDRWSSVQLSSAARQVCGTGDSAVQHPVQHPVQHDFHPENNGLKVFTGEVCCTEPDDPFLFNKDITKERKIPSPAVQQGNMFEKENLPEEGKRKRRRSTGTLKASELRKNPAHAKKHIDALIRLNNLIADLPDGVMGSRPRKDSIARKVFAKWLEVQGRGERSRLRDFLVDPDDQAELIKHVQAAKMCHGEKWFTFEWLLSFPKDRKHYRENVHEEANIEKLFDGRYADVPDWLEKKRLKASDEKPAAMTDFVFDKNAYADKVRREEQATDNTKGRRNDGSGKAGF